MTTTTARPAVIRYGSGSTFVGRTLAVVTDRGVCGLHFIKAAADEKKVLSQLRRQFPEANLIEDPATAKRVLRQVDEVIDGERTDLDLPLDLHGTPFQLRVWKELRRVPRGQTWSYSELARRAGKPKAVRAAASACARNPVVVVVPCHRILRTGGGIGGYGGGLDLKRALLEREMS